MFGGRNFGAVMRKMCVAVWTLAVLFFNVENFFDTRDSGGGDSDREFSARGERRWTRRRFDAKCAALAKTLFYAEDALGALPDLVGFAEVENRYVLRCLLDRTALKKTDYEIIHFESRDHRGIDVALLYRRSRLRLVDARPVRIPGLETRDILLAQFVDQETGDSLAVSVNHHPSKYGGAEGEAGRLVVARAMLAAHDSLRAVGWARQLAVGDFNDVPGGPAPAFLASALVPLAPPLAARGEGTIRFDGRWELIDQAFVSPELAPGAEMAVFRPPFLLVKDTAHGGEKPLRTYVGPRYNGGVSDHLPILVRLSPGTAGPSSSFPAP